MRNGFDLIKAFYSWVFNNQEVNINSNHIALYMFFINQNNRNHWVEWFKCSYDLAMTGSCIRNKKTYYKTLNDLVNWGLIGYIPGQAMHKSPLFSLTEIPLKKGDKNVPNSEVVGLQNDTQPVTQGDTQHDPQHDTQPVTQHDTQHDTLYKTFKRVTLIRETCNSENENLEKFSDPENEENESQFFEQETMDSTRTMKAEDFKKEKVPAKRKNNQLEILDQCQLPFQSDRFMKYWLLFLDYKQKQKKPYTSVVGMQSALKKCSEYPEEVIIQALTESMSNNWQGFFPEKIKTSANGNPKQQSDISLAEQFSRLRAKAHSGSYGK